MEMLDGKEMPKGFGINDIDVIRTLSGLEYLQGIANGDYAGPNIGKALQFRMLEVGEGTCTFTGVPGEEYYNPMGTVHGGYIATLLDSALACCVQTLCPVGYASTSVELKVNFVRPITAATGRVFAKAEVIHPGRQIATSQGTLVDENGKLYAHGTQTCSVFKIPD